MIKPDMSPAECGNALDRLGLSNRDAARVLGLGRQNGGRAVRRWRDGSGFIPGPSALLIQLMLAHTHIRAELTADLPADVRLRIRRRARFDCPYPDTAEEPQCPTIIAAL